MSQFSYRGRTANGRLSEGVREAPGAEVLADLLQAEGIIPISIQPVKAAGASFDLRRYFSGGVKKKVQQFPDSSQTRINKGLGNLAFVKV